MADGAGKGIDLMRAMVIDEHGGPEVLRQADLPLPVLGEGQVLVRVRAAAVNPADTKWRAGHFASFAPVRFPHVLGYDIAGDVVSGQGVAPGTRVAAMLDTRQKGGYAEFAAVDASSLAVLPANLSYEMAAAIPTAGLAGVQLVDAAGIEPGQRILITGAVGAVGRFALHAARKRGARVVAAVRGTQKEEACTLGADDTLALGEEDGAQEDFDHVLDTLGGDEVGDLCCRVVPGGQILTVATRPIRSAALRTVPRFLAVQPSGRDLAQLVAAVDAGDISAPVARVLSLDAAAAAHQLVEAGGLGGKVILVP